jgi:mono/diheme cytochrome c family protein
MSIFYYDENTHIINTFPEKGVFMKRATLALLSGGLLSLSVGAFAISQTDSRNWLTDADEDTRYERLEYYLGGFSSAMWQTGERYQHTEQAIADGNYELAYYHWDKIKGAIERGAMKRPDRRANAEEIFLDDAWKVLAEALQDPDEYDVRGAFQQAKAGCLACHGAEEVPFMNDQPMFTQGPLGD